MSDIAKFVGDLSARCANAEADRDRTMDMYEDILSRNVMLVKEKDRLKARVRRLTDERDAMAKVAKQALAEQEGK